MARNIKKKNRQNRASRNMMIASVTGNYDDKDYAVDKAIVQQMVNQGGLTPKTEAQVNRILERMRRRSWD